jgi:hypothetical protein
MGVGDMNTTLLVIDYGTLPNGRVLGVKIPETPHDYTFEEALSDILSGAHEGELRAVHSIDGQSCADMSVVVSMRIVDALRRGDFVSPMARRFANFMCRDIPREAA